MKFIFIEFYNIWKHRKTNYFKMGFENVKYFPQKAMVIMVVNVICTKI